jgi:hypothetical protein
LPRVYEQEFIACLIAPALQRKLSRLFALAEVTRVLELSRIKRNAEFAAAA